MMIKAKQRFSLLLLTALFLISLLSGCVSSSSGTTNSVASEEASKPIATIFADYIPVTFDDLLKESKFIVYGEVFHVLPARERLVAKTSTQVYTPIGIIPIQTLKGNPPSPFIYNYIGGEFEGIVHQIDGDKRSFQEGDHVLVFLSKYSGDIYPRGSLDPRIHCQGKGGPCQKGVVINDNKRLPLQSKGRVRSRQQPLEISFYWSVLSLTIFPKRKKRAVDARIGWRR